MPTSTGEYKFSPTNLGLAVAKFALEHVLPIREKGNSLVHGFFWDVRKFELPWVHESDQSFGQFLSGYNNIGGFVTRVATEVYSDYLNSKGCKGVVTWSEWSKRGFVEDGVDASKVSVIPPPFGPIFDQRPHSGCNLLFLGRDYHRKGGDISLRAFRALPSDVDSRLVYVGRVDDSSARRAIKEDRRITHLERPSDRTLAEDVWPLTDILVLPTRADAFAVTLVEAMRRGIPVVASSVGAIPEVVEDGRSGLLFGIEDEGGFLLHLQRLVHDPALRRRLGEDARTRVGSLFLPEVVNRELKEVYLRGA